MKRSEAREMMMQVLFQIEAQKGFDLEDKLKYLKGYKGWNNQQEYVDIIYNSFITNKDRIDRVIEDASNNWTINRMGKVDLAVLRVAVTELLYVDDIPTSVSINEAINLAKTFGTDDSGKFVNGILGNVAKQLEG